MTEMKFCCFIPGKPTPQGSTKAFAVKCKGGNIRAVTTSANPKMMQWRAVAVTTIQNMRESLPAPIFSGPVCVSVDFIMPRLSSHPKTHKGKSIGYPCGMPDLDKLLRTLGDALTVADVVSDDSAICQWMALKRYADIGEQAGTYVCVEALPPVEAQVAAGRLEI